MDKATEENQKKQSLTEDTKDTEKGHVKLSEGSGGREMHSLIGQFTTMFEDPRYWKECANDAAVFDLGDGRVLCFTTDSFTVSPLFFQGGNIGDLAMCGTINDICVMGSLPIGISLSVIIEEGFAKRDLEKIMQRIADISKKTGVPIVTGDTKVVNKGNVDGIIINTSAIGICARQELLTRPIEEGDKVIISGSIGDHAVALLSERFDYRTELATDSQPLIDEIKAVKDKICIAKDPTRGGIAASLNEICQMNCCGMKIEEQKIPLKEEVIRVTEILGLNAYELACEGRFICIAKEEDAGEVEMILKRFNPDACIIGTVVKNESSVILKTKIGERILPMPSGNLVPRIC